MADRCSYLDLEWLIEFVGTHEFLVDGDLTDVDRARDARLIAFLQAEVNRRNKQACDRALVKEVAKKVGRPLPEIRVRLKAHGMIGGKTQA